MLGGTCQPTPAPDSPLFLPHPKSLKILFRDLQLPKAFSAVTIALHSSCHRGRPRGLGPAAAQLEPCRLQAVMWQCPAVPGGRVWVLGKTQVRRAVFQVETIAIPTAAPYIPVLPYCCTPALENQSFGPGSSGPASPATAGVLLEKSKKSKGQSENF